MVNDVGIECQKVEKHGQSAACMQRDDSIIDNRGEEGLETRIALLLNP